MKKHIFKGLPIAIIGIVSALFIMSCNKENEVKESTTPKTEISTSVKTSDSVETLIQNAGLSKFPTPTDIEPFAVPGLKGDSFSTENLEGKVTVLNFWAPWCNPCRREMPELEEFYSEFKDVENFQLIATGVSDSKIAIQTFIEKNGYTFPVYVDEQVAQVGAYASRGIPATYIVNKDGKLIAGTIGACAFNSAEFKALIKELLK